MNPLRSKRTMAAILFLISMAVGAPAILADGPQTATLEGRVLDVEGAPLPGVTINLVGPQGSTSTTTNEDGSFRFGLLVGGEYTVGASLEGLGATELKVSLGAGERRSIDLSLAWRYGRDDHGDLRGAAHQQARDQREHGARR